ncbi:LamG-like jellyroll fold domain-containing protein [Halapricum salinum]|mgnify:FL=1|uniref:LamG domain-containing protein n=1 Tax=Halapricum salinum TaxID=1457250 RepID=A0A4D6HDJ2_9EURY|nr:LamG-like jellyroll fold domain-containing protein [Halapricum salinum]QCC52164.1 hypothetical protein DV733_13405 [Halapricum salinum]
MGRAELTRRRVLSAGGLATAGGLAGCTDILGGSDSGGPDETGTVSEGVLSSLPLDVLLTFDDGIEDVSGNDRPVSVEGGELVEGRSGQALRLRPPDEYFTVQSGLESPGFDSGDEAEPFSYAAWVQIHSAHRHELFTNEGSRRRLAINSDRQVCGRMWGGRSDIEGSPACGAQVPLEEWVHVGFVFTGTEGRVYYNGDEIARNPWRGYTGSAKTCSGSRAAGGGDCEAAPGEVDATIDEWAIIRTDVSQSTMRELASA